MRRLIFYFFSLTISMLVLPANAQKIAWPKASEKDVYRGGRTYNSIREVRDPSSSVNPVFRSEIYPANSTLITSFKTRFREHWDKFQSSEFKSVSSLSQSLDSIITLGYDETTSQWINEEKEEFSYDTNGNLSMYAYYGWDGSIINWIGEKVEFGYDMYGNFTSVAYYYWDESTEQWTFDEGGEIDIEYDANGNIALMIFYYKDQTTNQRMNEEKEEFTYDDNGNQTLYISSYWDETSSQWMNNEKEEFAYDDNGNQTLYISSYWDENSKQWINDDKEQFTYDDKGNQTLYLRYGWDESSSQWVLFFDHEYAYDENDNQILIKFCGDYNMDGIIECNKVAFTYDSNGNKTSESFYSQENSTSPWIFANKFEWTYDESGNPVMKLWYYEGVTQATEKSVATYDLSHKMSDITLPSSEWEIFDEWLYTANKLLESISYSWDNATTSWTYKDKIIYYYSGESQLSNETDILSYSFSSPPQIGNSMINTETHAIKLEVEKGSDLSNLVATFEFSQGAIAEVGGVLQESGITSNDFTSPVSYEVIAEDGKTKQDWVVTVEAAVGIENTGISNIHLYPNPFSDKTTIQFSNPKNSDYILVLYDISGVKQLEMNGINTETIELERENLPSGIYLLELRGDEIFRGRIIVE